MVAAIRVVDHPLVRTKLAALRISTTPAREFRMLLEDLGMLLTYEASWNLEVCDATITTPIAVTKGATLSQRIGLVPILRAGIGMLNGALHVFPDAQVWHLGVYRDEHRLVPVEYYNRLPQTPTVDRCFILDPMLATGGSAVAATDVLKRWGICHIHFIGVIGSPEGVYRLSQHHPDVAITLAAIDDHLNDSGFIVPGLGDAGDRQFGTGIYACPRPIE
ncbi:MAG: uracil phosphoribosyltransferase [Chloroflexi bacterium]|nr:uracil phosphoribosyltransferase [Chloroflexota bacterium]